MPQKTETESAQEIRDAVTGNAKADHSASPPPAEAPPAAARRAIPVWAILVVLVVIVGGGIWIWNYFSQFESTDDAQVDGHINPISSRVSGYIIKVNVNDNQYVEAGAILAEIDPKDYQVAVDKAKADLASAEASAMAAGHNVPITTVNTTGQLESANADISNTQAGIVAAQQQWDAAKASLTEAQANDVKAQNDLARYKQLVDKQEVSQQQYDQAVAAAKASTASVAAATASVSASEAQVRQAQSKLVQSEANRRTALTGPRQVQVSEAQFTSADALVAQKKAELEQQTLNLQYCTIVAPVAGVVNKDIEVGMNVQPGQQLLSIVPLDDVWVTADFKETQLRHMRPGQPVEMSVDAFGRKYNGHVDSIAGASGSRFSLLPPENATGNFVKVVQRVPVKIVLDPGQNNDRLLRPGMSVEPKVRVK
jgi:membrane fusion protein (multidrug efflux system)